MSNLPFEFTAADRSALIDELTKLIARVPLLVGTEVNWIEQAIESILRGFEEQGMRGEDRDQLIIRDIEDKLRLLATSVDPSAVFKAASSVYIELRSFFRKHNQSSRAKDSSIPTDETHDFGVIAKELIDNGSGIDMLQVGPSVVLTEAQALKALEGLKGLDDGVEFVLIARPKPPRWTVLDYQG